MRRFAAVLAVSIVLLGAAWAQAALTSVRVAGGDLVTMSVDWNNCYIQGNETGGEFGMAVTGNVDASQDGTFYTFCADPLTLMSTGIPYTVNTVANTNHGGYELQGFGKWIYYEYASNGLIPGHGTSGLTTDMQGAIQMGIWSQLWLTDSNHPNGDSTKTALAASGWNPALDSDTALWSTWYTEYNNNGDSSFAAFEANNDVEIANLVDGSGAVQNQTVLTVVYHNRLNQTPEPATIVVWSLLGAAGWLGMRIRRRRAA